MPKKKEEKEEKKKGYSLSDALKEIRKEYGDEAITTFDSNNLVPVQRISTGIATLDMILGGGLPMGRIIELYGPESSGKTTVALKVVAKAQSEGKTCAYIDMEHAIDPIYAQVLGVNMKALQFSQPDYGEMALSIAEKFIRSGEVAVCVVDSTAALVPKAELDGEMGEQHVGLLARLMSQSMRKLAGIAANNGCVVIFINQLREKIGGYGNPETTPGGRALKFYASVRMDVRKRDPVKQNGEIIGHTTEIKTVKNKTFPPFKSCRFDVINGVGPDDFGALIDVGLSKGVITQGGAWFNFENERYQGKQALAQHFKEAPEDFEYLQELIQNAGKEAAGVEEPAEE